MASTKISTVYAALVALLTETFPDARRLENVESLEDNPASQLKYGWGLSIGPGNNTNRNICPNYSQARKFTVILSREFLAKDGDVARRDQAKIALLEDAHLLFAAAVDSLTLDGAVLGMVYETDGGPQEIQLDDKPFLFLEATFNVEYIQQV